MACYILIKINLVERDTAGLILDNKQISNVYSFVFVIQHASALNACFSSAVKDQEPVCSCWRHKPLLEPPGPGRKH